MEVRVTGHPTDGSAGNGTSRSRSHRKFLLTALPGFHKGDWNDVDMVAVFGAPGGSSSKGDVEGQLKAAVPQIQVYGPEKWERIDLEIEWGFKGGTEKADFDGRVEGFFGLVSGPRR